MKDYTEFLESKRHSIGDFGFKPNYLPDAGFDFQNYIIEKAVRKGRIVPYILKTIALFRDPAFFSSRCWHSYWRLHI